MPAPSQSWESCGFYLHPLPKVPIESFLKNFQLEKLQGATPKLLDNSTFEPMSPEELEQAEEESRHQQPQNEAIQFPGKSLTLVAGGQMK